MSIVLFKIDNSKYLFKKNVGTVNCANALYSHHASKNIRNICIGKISFVIGHGIGLV